MIPSQIRVITSEWLWHGIIRWQEQELFVFSVCFIDPINVRFNDKPEDMMFIRTKYKYGIKITKNLDIVLKYK